VNVHGSKPLGVERHHTRGTELEAYRARAHRRPVWDELPASVSLDDVHRQCLRLPVSFCSFMSVRPWSTQKEFHTISQSG
jgi:hypothetical protein